MEANTMNTNAVAPTESHYLDEHGELPKDLMTDILNGVCNEDTVNFEDKELFMMPPLFTQPISKETLQDDQCFFILWATLKFRVPANPSNAKNVLFNSLEDFINFYGSKDKNFTIFLHILSEYQQVEDLPL